MGLDPFDYDELSRNVEDLLNDEYGVRDETFDVRLDGADLPDDPVEYRNAANGYGVQQPGGAPEFDEEAAAMRYDPQTNSGAAIRAYNTDYASRAAKRANRNPPPKARRTSDRADATQQLPRRKSYDRADATQQLPRGKNYDRQEVLDRIERRPRRPERSARPAPQPVREEAPVKKEKKHGFLKFLIWLLILLILAMIALWIFAKQPEGDSLGVHRDGCSAILLAGTDADGARTDTMMLLYVDQNAGELNLLSLPRDTYTSMDFEVPKLNAVYGVAGGGKEGMERLMDYAAECIGYRPDGYILVDLDCFEKIVNVMGGVRFDVPCDMQYEDPYQDLYIDLKAGEQKLNGKQAMWLVRFRAGYAEADLKRVQVQRDFMREAIRQWSGIGRIWRAPAAAVVLSANTTTDLSARELAWIAKAIKIVGTKNMYTETLPGEAAYIDGGSFYVLWPETTADLVNGHFNPYREDVSSEDIYSPYY